MSGRLPFQIRSPCNFNQWTIGRRLAVAFSGIITLVAGLAAFFFVTLSRVDDRLHVLTDDNFVGVTMTNEVLKETTNYRVLTLKHIIADTVAERNEIDQQCDLQAELITAKIQAYEKDILNDNERLLAVKLRPALDAYREQARALRKLSAEGKDAEAAAMMRGPVASSVDAFLAAVTGVVEFNQKDATANSGAMSDQMKAGRSWTAGITADRKSVV